MKTPAIRKVLDRYANTVGDDHEDCVAAEAELLTLKAGEPQAMVAQFHRKMGLPVASEPTVGTPEQRVLRVRLMLEEVLEFAEAAKVNIWFYDGADHGVRVGEGDMAIEADTDEDPDLAQMTHELADVQYVVSGTAVELGLPVREAVPIIHEANMRKEPVLDSGGKVRKPDGWAPADVSGLLRK